jgi:hypothetical protein
MGGSCQGGCVGRETFKKETAVTGAVSWFDRISARRPAWTRVLIVPVAALTALGMATKRGWVAGVVVAVVCGGTGHAYAIAPSSVRAWSRRHPRLDGAILGPLTFLAAAYLTSRSWSGCLLLGVAGVLIGGALGVQRERRLATQE